MEKNNNCKTDKSMDRSVIVLPGTQGDILCIAFRDYVRLAEYQPDFYDRMKRVVDEYGHYRLLVHYRTDFKGWEKDAAALSFQSISEMGKFARRIAYVNPPERKIFQTKLQESMLGDEVRIFNEEEYDEALAWLTAPA